MKLGWQINMSNSKATKRPSNSDDSFLGFDKEANKKPVNQPTVEYKLVEKPESIALETVFNYLLSEAEKELKL
jgi:hypothetical protein